MISLPQEAKVLLRRRVKQGLQAMTEAQRAEASAQARALMVTQPLWREAQSILFFAPLAEELDVWPLAVEASREGKRVFLPRFVKVHSPQSAVHSAQSTVYRAEDRGQRGEGTQAGHYVVCEVRDLKEDIRAGQFGIREPVEGCSRLRLKRLDLILVPGVAFDLHGRRLGRGKGFYDTLLAVMRGTTCGVAFDQQIVGEIPVEPHDVHLNCILTPTRWIAL
jgi:5-formyltetrahydrofolate cyclo-ligase